MVNIVPNCKICNKDAVPRSHYWKEHKVKESDYYAKYEPKFDLYTGELIEFKSGEQYYLADVNNKINLRKYLEEKADKTGGLNYLIEWLKKRKSLKDLKYAPSHFELRTLPFPSVKFIQKFYGSDAYQHICEKSGLMIRYDYNKPVVLGKLETSIQIDTREATPLDFSCEKIIGKLDFGDYAPHPNPHSIFVERKSLNDALGTLSGGFERFRAEMSRAQNLKCNVVIVIETEFGHLSSDQYIRKLRFTKVTSDFILKRIRDLLLEFPNIQIVCANDRKQAASLIEKMFKLEYDPMIHDYQYLIDSKGI
jgi:hypothetical protein